MEDFGMCLNEFTFFWLKFYTEKEDWRSEFLQFGVYPTDRISSVFLKVSEPVHSGKV